MSDPALDVAFIETHRCCKYSARSCIRRHSQQHFGIFLSVLPLEMLRHRLVAGFFHITAQQVIRQPDHRIHPMHDADQICQYFPQIIQAAQVDPLMLQHAVIEFRIHLHRQIDLRSQDSEYHRCADPVHVTYALLPGEAFRQAALHSYIRKNKICKKTEDSCQPQASACKCHPQKGCRCEKRGCCAGGLYLRRKGRIRSCFRIRTLSCHRIGSGCLFRQVTLSCHSILLR